MSYSYEFDQDCENHEQPVVIADRGRGPEIAGTRITVYRIMDFFADNQSPSPEEIAEDLQITVSDVRGAIAYIEANQDVLHLKYDEIMGFTNRENPPEINASRAVTADELRRRIMDRHSGGGAHDRPVRQ